MRLRWLGFKFEPRDLWIGVYWKSERHLIDAPNEDGDPDWTVMELTFYICLVPMLPLRIRLYHSGQEGF